VAYGIVLLIFVWQILSFFYDEMILPSPKVTLITLFSILSNFDVWQHVYLTVFCIIMALIFGTLFGITLGILASFSSWVNALIKPVKDLLIAIPPVALVILAIIWFGEGTLFTTIIVSALVFPLIYESTVNAIKAVDQDLIEMANVFQINARTRLLDIYLPSIIFYILANFLLAAGLAVRMMILAEILGATKGIGHLISMAQKYLITQDIFAWLIILITIILAFEGGLVYIIKKYLLRWQTQE